MPYGTYFCKHINFLFVEKFKSLWNLIQWLSLKSASIRISFNKNEFVGAID